MNDGGELGGCELGQEDRGAQADGHTDDNCAQCTPDAGHDKGQDTELGIGCGGLPDLTEEEIDGADFQNSGQTGDDHIDSDKQNGSDGNHAANEKHGIHHTFDDMFDFHRHSLAGRGKPRAF